MRFRLRLLLLFLILVSLLTRATVPPAYNFDIYVAVFTAPYRFDLAGWECTALARKAVAFLRPPARGLAEPEATSLVRSYLTNAQRIGELERKIEAIYSDLNAANPDSTTQAIQAEIAALRRQQDYWRPRVEAVIEAQITTALAAEGLTTANLIWPTVMFHFTEPPNLLIISPRERIANIKNVSLRPDMSTAEKEALETEVDTTLGVRSLVEGTGGYSTFPTMVMDQASLAWVLDTVAHEWTHTYLWFHPLGWHYHDNPGMVTINETVASLVGEEISRKVLAEHYPDLLPPPHPPQPPGEERTHKPDGFDFNAEMRATRLAVDKLLAQGHVEEAEAFMEARRLQFVAAGFHLRKLNQAYFAFHGSYAISPAAVDPIGPKLRQLRAHTGSLRKFLLTVRSFRSPEDLDRALALTAMAPNPAPAYAP